MPLKAILKRVEKRKDFVYHRVRFADDGQSILVDIRPHGRSRPVCSGCGKKGAGYDRLPGRRFELVSLWSIPVLFL